MTTATGLHFASGLSDQKDADAAIRAVMRELAAALTGPVDLAVVFATPHFRDKFNEIHGRLRDTLGARHTIGVTAGGVIGVKRETENSPGLSVLAASLPGVTLSPFSTEGLDVHDDPAALRRAIWPSEMAEAGAPAGADVSHANAPAHDEPHDEPISDTNDADPRAILFLADPFSTAMTALLPGLGKALPHAPVIGGMASGARQPGGNRLLLDGAITDAGGVGLAIGGDVRVDLTVSQGCRPIGKPYVITKCQHNIIKELGGRGCLDVAKEMLETLSEEDRQLLQVNGWHLGRVVNEYKERFGRGDFLIRHIIGIDPNHGYMAVGDTNMRVGQTVQFHVRDQRTAREDFAMLLEAQKLHGNHGGALLFSCNGRGTNLFDEPNTDATIVYDALGDIPLAGCFAAGEIGPVGHENHLHGHTASLAVIRPSGA